MKHRRVAGVVVFVILLGALSSARADLIAHYTFDDGQAFDETGNGFDGVPDGDATAAGEGSGVDGEGQAFRFSGLGHIELPIDVGPSSYPQLSVTMWVRADAAIVDAPGLYKTFGHDNGGWDRTFGLDNRPAADGYRWAAFTGGARPEPTLSTGTPVSSAWTFLAAVWNTDEFGDASVRLYADDRFIDAVINNSDGHTTASIGSLRFDNFNEAWRGLIDEVQIWDEALSEEAVEKIRAEVPPPEPGAPLVETLAAGGLASEGSANLRGRISPNGAATSYRFEWGETTDYGMETPLTDGGAGFGEAIVSAPITGLSIETTYHFRLVATNENGTSLGEDQEFLIPDRRSPIARYTFDDGEPLDESGNERHGVVMGDALAVGLGNGVDGEGDAFEFFGAGNIVLPIDINPSTFSDLTVTMWVKPADFVPDTPALRKVFGHDDGGWDRGFGLDNRNGEFRWAAFTGTGITGPMPTPVTAEWTFLATVWDSPVLGNNGTVRLHANENNVSAALTNGPSAHRTAALGSLRPDNFNEGWVGLIDEVQVFGAALTIEEVEAIRAEVSQPEVDEPTAVTLGATAITPESATVHGRVTPNGATTRAYFEYGLTTAYGSRTPEVEVGGGFAASEISATLEGLESEQVYHYRVVAESDEGEGVGEDATFRVPDRNVRLLYYSFDGGEPEDESGNERHGTVEGDATPAGDDSGFEGDGESFEFFGFGRINAPIDINPSQYPDLTVTMWVKADESVVAAPGLYRAFGHDDGGWDRAFGLDNRSGVYQWSAFTGSGVTLADTTTPVSSDWTFLAAVWDTAEDGTATIRLHAAENSITEDLLNTPSGRTTTSIGSLNTAPNNFAEGWVGRIDEVQIFGRALSVEEVDAIRTGEPMGVVGPFLRGDCDQSGNRNLTDGILLLNFLFGGGLTPECPAACDNDGSGQLDISTAIYLFSYLFLGGPAPPAPSDACGVSTSPGDETLGCPSPRGCA